jgi:flagellar M-ring protein FliF
VNGLLDSLRALGPGRLAAMGAVTAAMFGLLALLMLHAPGERMALLYGDLDPKEAGQVVEMLERQHVPNTLSADGSRVLVPAGQVAAMRVMLAKSGLPTGGSIGYEIFDRSNGFTTSQFQQQIEETRALEGELARTIRAIEGVRAARVHLVLPRREPFAREQQSARASVLLTMAGPAPMDREGVQAVLNLVSAAVPGLRQQNIAVVDSRGTVLARTGGPVGPEAAAQTVEEIRRATEQRLSRAVEDMLERSLGPGKVRVEASVSMNFDQVHETQETFNPDGQVVRSTQSVDSSSHSTEATPTVSVQNSLPNANAGQSQAGTADQKREETTNYEISKTVRSIIRQQPQISRLSVAVMVDGVEAPGADGKPVWRPRSAAELASITQLVKTAVGFDAKRGDQVEVVSMRFAGEGAVAPPEPKGLFGLPAFGRADLMRLAQTGLLGLVALAALLFVLRPMVLRLVAPAPRPLALAGGAGAAAAGEAAALGGAETAALLGMTADTPAVPLLPRPGGTAADEKMVQVANIEGQLRASSIRRLGELVEKHPEESLSILRSWLVQERR